MSSYKCRRYTLFCMGVTLQWELKTNLSVALCPGESGQPRPGRLASVAHPRPAGSTSLFYAPPQAASHLHPRMPFPFLPCSSLQSDGTFPWKPSLTSPGLAWVSIFTQFSLWGWVFPKVCKSLFCLPSSQRSPSRSSVRVGWHPYSSSPRVETPPAIL